MRTNVTVDVIIPTYQPDEKLITIIQRLLSQSQPVNRIVLVNTEQKYFENFMRGRNYDEIGKYIEVIHVSAREFDHGASRNAGAKGSEADFLLFMTQDAVPMDDTLVENMLVAFSDEKISSCYARQMADENAPLSEKFSRLFNYPEKSSVKSAADVSRLGVKAYFCSNACAMYRRDVFEKLGRFPGNMIFNEDMVFAHSVIHAGYSIAYAADAKVIHSHNYTNSQQFHRNFDLAVSQAMHPEVFESVSSEAEGSSYAKSALKYFIDNKKPLYFLPFAVTCACRLAGYKLGKNYRKLSHRMILRCTMSPLFFKKNWS